MSKYKEKQELCMLAQMIQGNFFYIYLWLEDTGNICITNALMKVAVIISSFT